MQVFGPGELVIVNSSTTRYKDELGFVLGSIGTPGSRFGYEVSLLSKKVPNCPKVLYICVFFFEVGPATIEEVIAAVSEWEVANHTPLDLPLRMKPNGCRLLNPSEQALAAAMTS